MDGPLKFCKKAGNSRKMKLFTPVRVCLTESTSKGSDVVGIGKSSK